MSVAMGCVFFVVQKVQATIRIIKLPLEMPNTYKIPVKCGCVSRGAFENMFLGDGFDGWTVGPKVT